MTITHPASGDPFEAQLEGDQFHMLWLINRNPRNSGRVQFLLSAALQTGWCILSASPEEQAMSDAHGFGSRRLQSGGQLSDAERGRDVAARPRARR
jgi:hypothetical protein